MSTQEISSKVQELRELRRMAEELQAEIEAIQDEIKGHMAAQDMDTLAGPDWRITWRDVTSSHLDSAALRRELPEIAARFIKKTTARRFVLA